MTDEDKIREMVRQVVRRAVGTPAPSRAVRERPIVTEQDLRDQQDPRDQQDLRDQQDHQDHFLQELILPRAP